MAIQWLEDSRSFVYPPTCLLCEGRARNDLDLCRACADASLYAENSCACCALPIKAPGMTPCGACQRRLPAFDAVIALCHYQPPIDYLIHQLNFHNKLTHARLLGCLLAEHLGAKSILLPECIIPTPLHARRVLNHGDNQALELTRHIGRHLRVPVDHRCVRRIRHTDPQTELSAKARRKNVRGAFKAAQGFDEKHMAIVDDVVTTGAEKSGRRARRGLEHREGELSQTVIHRDAREHRQPEVVVVEKGAETALWFTVCYQ
jgi:ComF family protein